MIKILGVIVSVLFAVSASAQTGTSKTQSQISTEINGQLIDNTTGLITPQILRQVLQDMNSSYPNGVFNVRMNYGAVPDGATDNSTAITNAFNASNSFTNGVPTVYFDCDIGKTTCVYNYGGSGTSPINPTIGTTIRCATGVTLNYTGTAHAADIGSGSNTSASSEPFRIEGCRWTGGANYTAGLYFNNWVDNSTVFDNVFKNFGNTTNPTILYSGNNFEPLVTHNYWVDNDGVPKAMIDAHNGTTTITITDNVVDCSNGALGNPCQVSPTGYGLWLLKGRVMNNILQYHYPMVRLSALAGGTTYNLWVVNNHFEGNANSPSPLITFGDPGTAGSAVGGLVLDRNFFFWTSANTNIPFVGPETASSGSFVLANSYIYNNYFAASPGSGALYVNDNSGSGIFQGLNRNSLGVIPWASLVTSFAISRGNNLTTANQGSSTALTNQPLAAWSSDGTQLIPANINLMAQTQVCANTAGPNAYTCQTAPRFNNDGSDVRAVTGTMIIFTSTTTNTGATTLAVNSASAAAVQRGGSALASGDIVGGRFYLMVYDGTQWEMMTPGATLTYP